MNDVFRKIILGSMLFTLIGCMSELEQQSVIVNNDLDVLRTVETVTIDKSQLKDYFQNSFDELVLKERKSGEVVPFQLIDENNDGNSDVLIFQPEIAPKSSVEYFLEINKGVEVMKFDTIAYSRIAPERIDDYAWENDRVAFRTFGPKAESLVVNGESGGVISSGVDCWLKRVEYPIINKWYKKNKDRTGDYHQDTGEGLDNFHVGISRGCGGIGVWKDSILLTSGNFIESQSISNGAIRTSFKLKYAAWEMGNGKIAEVKHVSLDKGSNLTKYEIVFDSENENLVAGLPIKTGEKEIIDSSLDDGWISVWRSHEDSELGMAVLVDPKYLNGTFDYYSNEKDKSHSFLQLKTVDNKLVYYAGFGWKKSGQYESSEEWNDYLNEFSMKLNSPISLTIN